MENRKVKMSKNLLKETLIDELEKCELSQITITTLCKKADLNRSTFYAHYRDIYALFEEIENEFLEQIPFSHFSMSRKEVLQKLLCFANYTKNHRRTYLCLMKVGTFEQKFIELSKKHNSNIDLPFPSTPSRIEKRDLLTAHSVSGLLALLREWLTTAPNLSPEEVSVLLCDLYYDVLSHI